MTNNNGRSSITRARLPEINEDAGNNINNINDIEDINDVDDDSDYAESFNFLTPRQSERPYTITEINAGIARMLDEHNTLVWAEGELSGWKHYPSGHCYFKLKDANSQIPCVMWKNAAMKLDFKPNDGMAVFAVATISVYEKGGYYQLNVHKIMQAGAGALHLAFERLREKLLREGLFDEERKKPLPRSVGRLGVITSKKGAALWDIVRVVARRSPQTDIILIDTAVQGDNAAAQIAKAIRMMNDYGDVDVMIVGRGGGSIEDLQAFNEEAVARAIYKSAIPVISAAGHEIDFTIADFVADVRAPTPSAAAEIAVADTKEGRQYYELCKSRFIRAFSDYIVDIGDRVCRLKSSRALRRPFKMILSAEHALDDTKYRFLRREKSLLQDRIARFRSTAERLNALSPLSILGRGYSIVEDHKGLPVRSVKSVELGDMVNIKFVDGTAGALVTSFEP